jgi:hypothetical protein
LHQFEGQILSQTLHTQNPSYHPETSPNRILCLNLAQREITGNILHIVPVLFFKEAGSAILRAALDCTCFVGSS